MYAPAPLAARLAELDAELQELAPEMQRAVAEAFIKDDLKRHVLDTLKLSPGVSEEAAIGGVMEAVLTAGEFSFLWPVCDLLIRCGFDASRITYRDSGDGVPPYGYAGVIDLLKFVGFMSPDAPSTEEAGMLMSLGGNSTKH